jgi:hypothetical protein
METSRHFQVLYKKWGYTRVVSPHNEAGLRNSLKQAWELIKMGQYDILRSKREMHDTFLTH